MTRYELAHLTDNLDRLYANVVYDAGRIDLAPADVMSRLAEVMRLQAQVVTALIEMVESTRGRV